jgi:hypothetical protein
MIKRKRKIGLAVKITNWEVSTLSEQDIAENHIENMKPKYNIIIISYQFYSRASFLEKVSHGLDFYPIIVRIFFFFFFGGGGGGGGWCSIYQIGIRIL